MQAPIPAPSFDEATANVATERPDTVAAVLHPAWRSLSGVHGGYVCAVAVRAVQETLTDARRLRLVSATFLRPSAPGPAEVRVEVLRAGRRLAVHRATVVQDGTPCAVVQTTFATHLTGMDLARPSLPRPDPTRRRPFDTGGLVVHFDRFEVDLDERWWPGGDGDRARLAAWVRLREDRPVDDLLLALVADVLPPSTFAASATPQGGMTLDLTVTLLDDPTEADAATGGHHEVTMTVEAEHVAAGIASERGVLWIGDRVVATTSQSRYVGQAATALSDRRLREVSAPPDAVA